MKRMVLFPEEKLLQYEQQQKSGVSHGVQNRQYGEKEHAVQDSLVEERKELSDDIIVRGIPKTMRTRAIALLERLRARPDVISWDDMGQVKIEGAIIPKSNISDLVSSAMRSRKYFDPIASQEFFNVLSNINVPKDLVRNEEGWKRVAQKGKGWGDQRFLQFAPTAPHTEKSFGGFASLYGEGRGKRKKLEEGYTQKGKGEIFSDDFLKEVREMKRLMGTTARSVTPWRGTGFGKREKPQEGGFAFGPYTQGLSGIEKKRRQPQKGGKLRKIPNWECYKG